MGFTNSDDEISVAKTLIELIREDPPKIETSDGSCFDTLTMENHMKSQFQRLA